MTAPAADPIDFHHFEPGLEVVTKPDAAGHARKRIRCRRCGQYSNGPHHRSPESRREAELKREATVRERYGTLVPTRRQPRPPRTVGPHRAKDWAPPDYHPFEFGGETKAVGHVNGSTRLARLCKVCGSVANAPRHRSPEQVAATAATLRARNAAAREADRATAEPSIPPLDSAVAESAPEQLPEEDVPPAVAELVPGRHDFVPGGEVAVIETPKGQRLRQRCAECGQFANAPRHRSPEAIASWVANVRAAKAAKRDGAAAAVVEVERDPGPQVTGRTPYVRPDDAPRPRALRERIVVPSAEVTMLALAIDAALALPADALSWKLRLRLAEARNLIDLPVFPSLATPVETVAVEPAADAPSEATIEALPQLRPVPRTATATVQASSILRGIRNDRMRNLARRAVSDGWAPSLTGSGHLALDKGQQRLVLSTTATGHARGWQNARAQAKRVGIDVTGL